MHASAARLPCCYKDRMHAPRLRIGRPVARLAAALLAFLLAGCGVDAEQARLCAATVGAFAEHPERVEIVAREAAGEWPHAVTLRWRLAGEEGEPRRITCAFAGGRFDAERLTLTAVTVDRTGPLTDMEMFWLRRWLAMPTELLPAGPPRAEAGTASGPLLPLLYALQQLVNAVTLACVYGLLAIGYTLIYAVIGQINLAFGDIAMVGAVVAVIAGTLSGASGAAPAALVGVLAAAAGVAMAAAWAGERLVFRPLRDAAPHAVLVGAVGLAILLREGMRLLQGSGDLWLQPPFDRRFALAEAGGFHVVLSLSQILILTLTALAYAAVAALLGRTRFGLAYRACAQDRQAAALLGIDVDRTVGLSFALGGALAGVAAFVIVEYYGVANVFMGLMLGFKALAAAIVGGLGSVPGAMLGGAVIAVIEIFWSAYFDIAYKDIALFGLLILMLVLRPAGLLGRPAA